MSNGVQEIMDDEEEKQQARIINDEYKMWKKNTPFLYDVVVTHALEWPTLSVQWFPEVEKTPGQNYSSHRLLLGTNTSGYEQNYLEIASVHMPLQEPTLDTTKYDEDRGEIGSYGGQEARVKIIHRINHEGEVNKARYMPQNPDIIASKATSGDVFIFDRTKHPSEPNADGKCKPDMILKGHKKEGFGLDWSMLKRGHLLSSAEDHLVCHWDVETGYSKKNSSLDPLCIYSGHTDTVNDVNWHRSHADIFASAGEDMRTYLWDTRKPSQPTYTIQGHEGGINSVAFSPSSDFMLLTASTDTTIGLWDIRNLQTKLHSFEGHQDQVTQVSWSPTDETVFASCSADRRVNIWDISRIGDEQSQDDQEDGPPELLFMHGGHMDRLADLSWSPNTPWLLATCAEDNVLMAWSPNASIYVGESVQIPDDELEMDS